MSKKVDFTAMEDGTRSDYDLVFEHDAENGRNLLNRILIWLKMMEGESPYKISRLDHVLQTATRAEKDGADNEMIVCALLHDIGDVLAPTNHAQVAAALLRPYVSEKNYWIVLHHGLFQGYYWMHHYDKDRDARDKLKDHPYYEACVEFCARWDQVSFDPNYDTYSLEHFIPVLKEVFSKEPASFV
jgi:predicted HD phosphohydrolase|tara:strand:+ start:5730 stop:6287 length:558 start_codon:yes stop_codon:yes gene_type:complete